jgi:predicted ATPase
MSYSLKLPGSQPWYFIRFDHTPRLCYLLSTDTVQDLLSHNLSRKAARMRALESIDRLEGYKSIRELKLELRPLNVLIGPNGAGKSNLISVFELLNQIVRDNLATYVLKQGGADTFLTFGRQITEQIHISLTFEGAEQGVYNGYGCVLVPTVEDTLIFADEWCELHRRGVYPNPMRTELGGGHASTQLLRRAKQPQEYVVRHVLKAMQSWRVYHFHDTSETARIKGTGDINDNEDLRDDARNLAAYLYLLKQRYPEIYDSIVAVLRMVAPFFDDFDLKPSRLNPDKIRLEWREQGSDAYFNAHALSDGTLRFICLATLLHMPDPPATIIIDEPELGLHPYAITLLAAMLRSAATRTQVIVSTQSVTLVNQFAPEDVIVVDRTEDRSIFTRPDAKALEDWLEEYGVGDLWEKNLLGGRPAYVEDVPR